MLGAKTMTTPHSRKVVDEYVYEGAEHRCRDLRIENTLTGEQGDDVRLKKGAHVDVTATAEPKTSTAAID